MDTEVEVADHQPYIEGQETAGFQEDDIASERCENGVGDFALTGKDEWQSVMIGTIFSIRRFK